MSVCPSCGHENEPGAKFCSQCATPLAEVRAGATERKIVTVLFADLVGFTSRAERLDPEDVEAILRPYHERLRYELERWGGTVEKFIGDAVMALFGAPVTREDDPERAIRAALAIRDWIREEGKLEVRIGITTGEALVNLAARPEAGEGMAAGDVVNTAARLQAAAPTNGILVGETTHRATAQTIDFGEQRTIEAKGKEEPLPVWEVVQARASFGVDLAPQTRVPLVGRRREVEQLVGALVRTREQRSTELITLVGVPGIGKSRLVAELFAAIETGGVMTYFRQGRSLPYGEGVSYWALSEMLKAHAGILETDSADEADAKLRRALEGLIEQDAEWVRSHLRPLVGQASELAGGSREEAFAAWRRFFEALAEQRPLVLVFEDIQWADEGMLDFIEHLVDWVRDVPLLILCTARLELLERRPAWGGGKLNAATIAPTPLTDEETAKLISALSERPLLEAQTQAALLERAGGNPLYAEQYVRMLAERGSVEDLPLPESVQGIIAARLDGLPSEEKALLQDAAVIGKVFWLGLLSATEQQLHALQQKEFVQRARRSSVEGEVEFSFKHLLVRDVAYGQIPRAQRAEKHRRAAEWIEALGRPEDHAEMVAHHYASALELARAAGRDLDSFANRTRVALREAGDRAAALNALPQAEHYFADALELTPDGDPERPELLFRYGRIRWLRDSQGTDELTAARDGLLAAGDRETAAEAALLLASAAWHAGGREGMLAHLDDARALVGGAPASRAQASVLCEVSRYDMLGGHSESAIEIGREALELAEQLGLDDLRARALNNIGAARGFLGDAGGLTDLEQSIALAERGNDMAEAVRARNNLIVVHYLHGDVEQSRVEAEELYRLARRFGNETFVRFLEGGFRLGIPSGAGEWDETLERADAFIAEVEGGSPHYQASNAYSLRALIRLARGDDVAAEADAARAIELARPIRDPQRLQPTLAQGAFVFLSTGREPRAQELLEEALAGLREQRQLGFSILELGTLAFVALRFGRAAEIMALIEREPFQSPWAEVARAVLASDFQLAADILDRLPQRWRAAFFRLRAAEQLVAQGRRAEADEQLRPALAFYRSVGATRYVREGEALLAASA